MATDCTAAVDLNGVRRRAATLADADAEMRSALDRLDPADVGLPSRLPGWTIGHVLSHLARNADGLANLLRWARTGVPAPMYPSSESRDADVEAGTRRPGTEILADYVATSDALAADIASMPDDAWSAPVRTRTGSPIPAEVVLDHRIAEVFLHHHDLGVDGGLADLSDEDAGGLLGVLMRTYVRTHEVPPLVLAATGAAPRVLGPAGPGAPVVSGPAGALAGWLTGRSDGSELVCGGPLPILPNW
jgi:maleylpyruvate isomerase